MEKSGFGRMMILILAVVTVFAFSTTALATTWTVGSGGYNCGSCPYNGGTYTDMVLGIDTHDQVTNYITDSNYCGYDSSSSYKAHATHFGMNLIDRVRVHSYENNNELRIDPNYTTNWVGTNYNTSARYVYCVQRTLYYLGYLSYSNIDGVWGNTTKNAVKSFQSNNGLTSDGVVGSITWSTLCSPNGQ